MHHSSLPLSRYRRRAWTIGVVLALVLFVVGAPRYVSGIEDDLEASVPAELAALGVDGVTAAFSGQDGTLTCAAPLNDPEAALAAAFDVRGVRDVELDRSCRVRTAAPADGGSTTVDASAATSSGATPDATSVPTPTTTAPAAESSGTEPPEIDLSLAELVDGDSDLALLSVMLREAGLTGMLDGRAMTLFAPTDAAFDALPADVLALLRSEPRLMTAVMEHHVVDAALSTADLVAAGEVVPRDGVPIAVESAGDDVIVGGAPIAAGDIRATNGVMHQIDAVIVPDDVELRPVTGPPVEALEGGGAVTLTGVVATEVERQALGQAAAAGGAPVDDRLTVDPDVGLDDETTTALSGLVQVLTTQLGDGAAGFDGTELYLRGTYETEAELAAAEAAAAEVDAVIDLTAASPAGEAAEADAPDPAPTPAEIEDALNAVVADTPILFASASDVLDASAPPILDELAARLAGVQAVVVTVEGHTDSDGVNTNNQDLSERRAEAVVAALVERGVPSELLDAEGFGASEPVLVDGVEDKSASRRVEFRVVAVP